MAIGFIDFRKQKTPLEACLLYFLFYVFFTLINAAIGGAIDENVSLAQKEQIAEHLWIYQSATNSILCMLLLTHNLNAKDLSKVDNIPLYIFTVILCTIMGTAGLAAGLVPATLILLMRKEK